MAKFSLEIKLSAQKELDALDNALFARIDRKLMTLADNPRPEGCKKLKGYKDLWRIRVGDYRFICRLFEAEAHVTIIRVAHRKDVYEP